MRNLLFRNTTSDDKRKRVLASSEVLDKDGVRTIIRRHFICVVKNFDYKKIKKPLPALYILKERNQKRQIENFFCKIKGCVVLKNSSGVFLVYFMHSLKINLQAMSSAISYS